MGIYDEMAAEINRLRKENQELHAEKQYIRDLAANPHLSPSQKWAMWAVREKLGRTAREDEQLTEVNIREIGQEIGMSRQSAGDCIKSLAGTGALAREEKIDVTDGVRGGKQYRKRILVGLTLFSSRPGEIAPPSPRNHGGKRQRCEKCGGENLEIYQAYICKDCHHIHQAELVKVTKGRRGFVPDQLDS